MTKFFAPAYWPVFTDPTKKRVFNYTAPAGPPFSSEFYFDAARMSMIEKDYNDGVYMNTWYMQERPGFGYAEWRDDYPNGKVITFTTPIGWGEWEEIGGVYVNYPHVDIFRTWPPTLKLNGTQALVFEARHDTFTLRDGTVYRDVLQQLYQQFWGTKQSGARMWMAKGVGPIAIQWVAKDETTGKLVMSDRYDATVSEITTSTKWAQ